MPILNDMLIIFGLSIVVLYLFSRLKIPAIVGFILTGILAGPYGFQLVSGSEEVELLAEVGVILLLFTIGLEFSLQSLMRIRRTVLLGGSLQVLLTFAATYLVSRAAGLPDAQAIFMGFLISLSSTAIVLKLIQERAEVDTPHGYTALGILIFQDIIIVPMMLFTPILAGATDDVLGSLLTLLVQGAIIIAVTIVSARWIVPRVLYQIARTQSRELFLLSIIVIALAVTWLTSSSGLSLALGAFLAGLIISESEYSYQALNSIMPFRDVFTSFFFISIGMLLDTGFLIQNPLTIVLAVVGVLVLKAFVAGATTTLLGFPLRTAVLTGLALAQVGEFSFILSKTGVDFGLLSPELYQTFLAVAVITMVATPFVINGSHRISDQIMKLPLPAIVRTGLHPVQRTMGVMTSEIMSDHLIIIGYGLNGRNISRSAKSVNIPHIIIETNPETVREERKNGVPIYYGDATQEAVLEKAYIKTARTIVIVISDPVATRRITEQARRMNPTTHILVRTRYLSELKPLRALGANEVIPEEFETSIEIFTRVLSKYLVPRDVIEQLTAEIRMGNYDMLRTRPGEKMSLDDLKTYIPNIDLTLMRIETGAPAENKTLFDLNLRKKHGVTVLAISRGESVVSIPDGTTELLAGDMLVLIGPANKITEAVPLFRADTY